MNNRYVRETLNTTENDKKYHIADLFYFKYVPRYWCIYTPIQITANDAFIKVNRTNSANIQCHFAFQVQQL